MELGGKNLRELKKATAGDRFSTPTSLWIAKRMIESLEFLHTNGWLHRVRQVFHNKISPILGCQASKLLHWCDRRFCFPKPFSVLGRGHHGTRQLFIVDFGTARNLNAHRRLNCDIELPEPRFHGFCGTLRYASLGVHDKGAQVVA